MLFKTEGIKKTLIKTAVYEKEAFKDKNRTLRSYRVCISPTTCTTTCASSALILVVYVKLHNN